ncbi:hypothetical protein F2P81_022378 [Scophthalmus maximus]|uniref:Uncharacterized protein n=1 Tax=Scophthalmus maximus TaxID=52904 RepID=A0A6A4RY71_SCOMX|nr:hypothetical protein F2P81_022378 [Scophthalmus maximus]
MEAALLSKRRGMPNDSFSFSLSFRFVLGQSDPCLGPGLSSPHCVACSHPALLLATGLQKPRPGLQLKEMDARTLLIGYSIKGHGGPPLLWGPALSSSSSSRGLLYGSLENKPFLLRSWLLSLFFWVIFASVRLLLQEATTPPAGYFASEGRVLHQTGRNCAKTSEDERTPGAPWPCRPHEGSHRHPLRRGGVGLRKMFHATEGQLSGFVLDMAEPSGGALRPGQGAFVPGVRALRKCPLFLARTLAVLPRLAFIRSCDDLIS